MQPLFILQNAFFRQYNLFIAKDVYFAYLHIFHMCQLLGSHSVSLALENDILTQLLVEKRMMHKETAHCIIYSKMAAISFSRIILHEACSLCVRIT